MEPERPLHFLKSLEGKRAVFQSRTYLTPVIIEEVIFKPDFFEARLRPTDGIFLNWFSKPPNAEPTFAACGDWDKFWRAPCGFSVNSFRRGWVLCNFILDEETCIKLVELRKTNRDLETRGVFFFLNWLRT